MAAWAAGPQHLEGFGKMSQYQQKVQRCPCGPPCRKKIGVLHTHHQWFLRARRPFISISYPELTFQKSPLCGGQNILAVPASFLFSKNLGYFTVPHFVCQQDNDLYVDILLKCDRMYVDNYVFEVYDCCSCGPTFPTSISSSGYPQSWMLRQTNQWKRPNS